MNHCLKDRQSSRKGGGSSIHLTAGVKMLHAMLVFCNSNSSKESRRDLEELHFERLVGQTVNTANRTRPMGAVDRVLVTDK